MKILRIVAILLFVSTIHLNAQEWTDVTGFIKNPNFNNNRKFGWLYEDYEYWSLQTEHECVWADSTRLDVWQTLHGLPTGHYRLSVQAFYRDGNPEEAYAKYKAGTESLTAVLYVNDQSIPLKSLYTYSVNWPLEDYRWKANDSTYYCNHPFDATLAFADGAYWNSIEFDVSGDVVIGIKNDHYVEANLCVFDNFRLEYQGSKISATNLIVSLDKTEMVGGERQKAKMTLTPANTTIHNILWTSSDAFICAVNQKGEVEARNPGKATLTAITTDGSELSQSIEVTVTEKTIEDTREWKDITFLLVNPSFTENAGWTPEILGWDITPKEIWGENDEMLTTFGKTDFQVSQVIENLPKGHYRLTMQGFSQSYYYPGDFFRYIEGDSTSYAYLYAGDVRKTLKPYSSYIHTTKESEFWNTYDEGKHYYPGDPVSQAFVFAEGGWTNTLEFDVEEKAADVKIGVGLDKYYLARNEAVLSNFRLETSDDIDLGKSYKLTILDADGNDITNSVTITWLNEKNDVVGNGSSIGGVRRDSTVYYSITFGEELGRIYREIEHQAASKDGGNISVQLEKIRKLKLHGHVKARGTDISRAMVNISQWLNGKYLYEVSERTQSDGTFDIEAYSDSTVIIITSDGYNDRRIALSSPVSDVNLGNIEMQSVQGPTIALNLSYQNATYENNEASVLNPYINTRDITYKVRNLTKSVDITDFAVQNNHLVLPVGNSKGDEVEVTIHSLNSNFADVTGKGTIAENDTARISLRLVAFGSVEVTYENRSVGNLLAMLYDSEGQLVMRSVCSTSKLTFLTLPEGTYTLITMEYRGTIGSLSNLSVYRTLDLEKDKDYNQTPIYVRNGVISQLTVYAIPELDASKFDYISDNTIYLANKQSLVLGSFVTMTANVNFKPEYAERTSNVRLQVDIPDGCEFIENSVVRGASPLRYSLSGNLLTIQLEKEDLGKNIKFCIQPNQMDKFQTTASVEFSCDGEKTQPIGQVSFDATGGEFYAPVVTRTQQFKAGGIGLPDCNVEVYANNRLIGQAKTSMYGRWQTDCKLLDGSNLSVYELQAKYFKDGKEILTSPVRRVTYNINGIVAKKVTMLNYVHKMIDFAARPTAHSNSGGNSSRHRAESSFSFLERQLNTTIYDFENIFSTTNSYTFWPEEPTFTFLIDLSDNDTTVVSNVVLYVHTTDGGVRILPAQYDGKRNCFVASDDFTSKSLPARLSLDFDAYTEPLFDAAKLRSVFEEYNSAKLEAEMAAETGKIEDFFNSPSAEDPKQLTDFMASCLNGYGSIDENETSEDLSGYSEEELETRLRAALDNLCDLGELSDGTISEEEMNECKIDQKSCDGIDINSLVSQGYLEVSTTEGTKIYIYQDENHFTYIDPTLNSAYEISTPSTVSKSRRVGEVDLDAAIQKCAEINSKASLSATAVGTAIELATIDKQKEIKNLAELGNALPESTLKRIIKGYEKDLREACVGLKKTGKFVDVASKAFEALGTAFTLYDVKKKLDEINTLSNQANEIQMKCKTMAGADALSDYRKAAYDLAAGVELFNAGIIAANAALTAAVSAAAVTAGFSAVAGLGIAIAEYEAGNLYEKKYENDLIDVQNKLSKAALLCGEDPPTPPEPGEGWDAAPKAGKEDPSGFVYEAVPSNRVEGVKASIFVQDEDGKPVFWDAEFYDEVNPQITNETGVYAWDVPHGMWKVLFEKEGYETTETEWLPVPPPQLEINIPMTHAIAPEVTQAKAKESGVTLNFSKYMLPATLTASKRISLEHKGKTVDGEVTLLNAEENPYNNQEYVSIVKFATAELLPVGDEVTVTVHKEVESYASKQMDADFVATLTVAPEFTKIVCEPELAVDYNSTANFNISVIPADAAKGKKVRVVSAIPLIATVDKDEVILDEQGNASITVNGELPGKGQLYMLLEDADLATTVSVTVVQPEKIVRTPKASKRSGSVVEKDYRLTLTSDTYGATIYYTLDGTCPCDEQSRLKYTEPITLPEGEVIIKAMAVRHGMEDSEVATFRYTVGKANIINNLQSLPLINIHYSDGMLVIRNAENAQCRIFDMQGRELMYKQCLSQNEQIRLITTDFYLVHLQLPDGQTFVRKISR